MKENLPKPNQVAKALGLKKTADLCNIGVDRLSQASLSDLHKNNPKKYELQLLGTICMQQDISIDELLAYCKNRTEIAKSLKNSNKFQENL